MLVIGRDERQLKSSSPSSREWTSRNATTARRCTTILLRRAITSDSLEDLVPSTEIYSQGISYTCCCSRANCSEDRRRLPVARTLWMEACRSKADQKLTQDKVEMSKVQSNRMLPLYITIPGLHLHVHLAEKMCRGILNASLRVVT